MKWKRNELIVNSKLDEILNGLMLGDGNLRKRKSGSIRLQMNMKYKKFLEWLKEILENEGMKFVGDITSSTGKVGIGNSNKEYTSWHLHSKTYYKGLNEIYDKWYPNGKKVIPKDLELTPITILHWYLGDGSKHFTKQHRSLRFATLSFTEMECIYLRDKLRKLGFRVSVHRDSIKTYPNIVSLYSTSVLDFFKYMGKCPKEIEDIYGYKWLTPEQKEYMLKPKYTGVTKTYVKSWTDEEIEYISSDRYNKTIEEMGKSLNRSISSIQHKLLRLGIRKYPKI